MSGSPLYFRFLVLFALGLLVAVSIVSCAGSPEGDDEVYVSLGDSLAVGVGSSEPDELGYAPLYRDALSERTGGEVRLVQLGISGETSALFIGEYPEGASQMTDAREVLRENPGAYVTLSLGGNDLVGAGDTNAERTAALNEYAANLDFVLSTLEGASQPAPRITVLALYNPVPGSFTDRWTGLLNDEIRVVAGRNGASVAAGDEAFAGNEEEYARASQYPWDIHPTDAGYAALAEAFAAAENP